MAPRSILRPVLTLLIVLFACTVLPVFVRMIEARDAPQTAEEAVRGAVCPTGDAPAELNERGTHRFEEGMLITYDARCSSASGGVSPPLPGYVLVEKLPRFTFGPPDNPIWGTYFWAALAPPIGRYEPAEQDTDPSSRAGLITHSAGNGKGRAFGVYAVLVGQVLAPERVASVEAVFDNGRRVRQRADQGVFAIAGLGASEVRELLALGVDGRVLQSVRLDRSE